jgi:prefoldin subunit 5
MTPKKALHPELDGFFTKHRAKSSMRRSEISAQMQPITQTIAQLRAHVMEMQADLQQAELAATADPFTNKLQYMHTRLAALDDRGTALFQAAREFLRVYAEVEQGLTQDQIDMVALMPGDGGASNAQ